MLHTTKTTEKFRRGVSDAQPLLGCELQNLVLRVLLCCCSKWEFCQWSLAAHAFCVLTFSSLLNDRTGSSEKSPHTRFLGAVESRGFFSVGSAYTISKQWALAAAAISVLSWMRRKAKNARVGCRFLPELIYSLEFHNNFSIIDTENCRTSN